MQVHANQIPGVVLIEPRVFTDARGCFFESYQRQRYRALGLPLDFVQDNHSRSRRGVLRGLHYQIDRPQAKLVWVVRGAAFDVVVDLRRGSPAFGHWAAVMLDDTNRRQIYVPAGCAHGFCALADETELAYKCTDLYAPEFERTIAWNDPDLAITWPIADPTLSHKDARGLSFAEAPKFDPPVPLAA
jgi:dTDP-4-dehydrorhamnose 3,5-epimerase